MEVAARWIAVVVVAVSVLAAALALSASNARRAVVPASPTGPDSGGPRGSAAAPRVHFVQFQGPPALRRTLGGGWRHSSALFCQTLLTAALHGMEATIIGPPEATWGQAWPMYSCKATRVWGIQRYVAQVPDGDVVFFIDAMDTLVLHDVPHIVQAAGPLLANDSVVFSGERNCYPWGGHCHVHPASPTTYRFVNAGGMVGRAGPNLRRFLDSWRRCTIDGFDDQLCANWLFADFPPARRYRDHRLPIKVDHHCTLFQSAWGSRLEGGPTDGRYREVEHGEWLQGRRLVNPETGTSPSLLHFNGWKGFMGYYFARLFPNVSWRDPRVSDQRFTVWGHPVRGPDFCSPAAIDLPTQPAARPPE